MIGRVYRGHGTAGLIRYLYGPARLESPVAHTDPHLVASWLGHSPAVLAALEPLPVAAAATGDGSLLVPVGGRGLSAGAARAASQLAASGAQGSVWDTDTAAGSVRVDHHRRPDSSAQNEVERGSRRPVAVPGVVDARHLVRALEAPLREQQRAARRGGPAPAAEHVWHVALRNADHDRRLSDAEWAQVAQDVVHRTGLSPRGPDGRPAEGGCPWVAVRHDDSSVHLVVVLAREDGKAVRLWRDYRQLRDACRAAEQAYGLTVTAPADGTADTHTSRAEVEKAARLARKRAAAREPKAEGAGARAGEPAAEPLGSSGSTDAVDIGSGATAGGRGGAEPARDQLRRHVQAAAAASSSEQEFFARLRAGGLLVRPRLSQQDPGQVTGYAVALPPAAVTANPGQGSGGPGVTADGAPVFFGGGKLAPDLTLPQLQRRWADQQTAPQAPRAAESTGAAASPATVPAARAWQQAGEAAYAARATVDAARRNGATPEQQHEAAAAAWAAADLVTVTARLLEGPHGSGPLSAAAQAYGRAARPSRANLPRISTTRPAGGAGSALRQAARVLGAVGRADRDVVLMLQLVAQIADLVEAVRGLREAQRHAAQAAAAHGAAAHLRVAVQQYTPPAAAPAAPSMVSSAAGRTDRRSAAQQLRDALAAPSGQRPQGADAGQPLRRPGPLASPGAVPPRARRR